MYQKQWYLGVLILFFVLFNSGFRNDEFIITEEQISSNFDYKKNKFWIFHQLALNYRLLYSARTKKKLDYWNSHLVLFKRNSYAELERSFMLALDTMLSSTTWMLKRLNISILCMKKGLLAKFIYVIYFFSQ